MIRPETYEIRPSIPFAEHLIEWLPEYALPEDELAVTHANMSGHSVRTWITGRLSNFTMLNRSDLTVMPLHG
jgi:hypothetical protein